MQTQIADFDELQESLSMTQTQLPGKRVVGKFFQNSKENNCDWALFIKLVALQLVT